MWSGVAGELGSNRNGCIDIGSKCMDIKGEKGWGDELGDWD